MVILDYIKTKAGNLKKYILRILTPLEYMEYVGKMLMVLEYEKVKIMVYISLMLSVVLLMSSYVVNFGIKRISILISTTTLTLISLVFLTFRKKMSRTTVTRTDIGDIKLKEVELPEIKLPTELEEYLIEIEEDEGCVVEENTEFIEQVDDIDPVQKEVIKDLNLAEDNTKEYYMDYNQFDMAWDDEE